MSYHSYEDWGRVAEDLDASPLTEGYSGTAVVQWHGNIERQLIDKIEKSETNRNQAYADKLREFLKIWRENEITGSINREQVDVLVAAAKVLAVDPWNYSNYFSNLRDQLRKLIAAAEELPALPQGDENGAMGTPPMRGSGSSPPPEFGPEEEGPMLNADGTPAPPATGETGGPTDEFDMDDALKDTVKKKTTQKSVFDQP